MPKGVHWVLKKVVMYNQVWTIHPSPLRLSFMWRCTFCMSVYLTEIWVIIDWQLLLLKPSKPKHLNTVLFPIGNLLHSANIYCMSRSGKLNKLLLCLFYISKLVNHTQKSDKRFGLTLETSAGGKCYVCMQAGVKAVLLFF